MTREYPEQGLNDLENEIKDLQRQLAQAKEVIKGIDRYIETECQEAWSNNWEGREGAFVDIAKKLKKLKEKGE